MKLKCYQKILGNPNMMFCILGKRKMLFWLPDKIYIKLAYYFELGRVLDLKNPRTYSEKIQWVKLYDRKDYYPILVDKIRVRDYISKSIGEEYLIPSLGVYDNPDKIDWDDLPNQFVLKCNHASSTNIICKDKNELDTAHATKLLKKWLKMNWYWYGREWAYKKIKPRILCEEYISDTESTPDDFKVICCNGEPKLVEVHRDRFSDYRINCYDTDWNLRKDIDPEKKGFESPMEKPACFEKMLELSRVLAQDTYIARIDWFVVRGKLYFGEVTLYEASGFVCKECDYTDRLLGDWIELPTIINTKISTY